MMEASWGILCQHILLLYVRSATRFDVFPTLDVIVVETVKWILGLLIY